nr:MAG TPA: hypothetical protein [Caudoviricetes sp.]
MEWNGGSPYMWVSEIEALCKGLSNKIVQGIKEGKEFEKIEVINNLDAENPNDKNLEFKVKFKDK